MQMVVAKIPFFDMSRLSSDVVPTIICIHPPRWLASTTVGWRRDMRCHQQRSLVDMSSITPMVHF